MCDQVITEPQIVKSKNGSSIEVCETNKVFGPDSEKGDLREDAHTYYRAKGYKHWKKSTYQSMELTVSWIQNNYFVCGRETFPSHPSRKANLLFGKIFDAISEDDRIKLMRAIDEFKEYVSLAGNLPDLKSSDLIDSFIENSNSHSIFRCLDWGDVYQDEDDF